MHEMRILRDKAGWNSCFMFPFFRENQNERNLRDTDALDNGFDSNPYQFNTKESNTDLNLEQDRMLFRPSKDTYNLDKTRSLIPVANKGDEKHNFIDGNTIGIVIDPRTRKAVGVLENVSMP